MRDDSFGIECADVLPFGIYGSTIQKKKKKTQQNRRRRIPLTDSYSDKHVRLQTLHGTQNTSRESWTLFVSQFQ